MALTTSWSIILDKIFYSQVCQGVTVAELVCQVCQGCQTPELVLLDDSHDHDQALCSLLRKRAPREKIMSIGVSNIAKVATFVSQRSGLLTIDVIAKGTDMNRTQAQNAASKAAARGLIKRVAEGLYTRLAEHAIPLPAPSGELFELIARDGDLFVLKNADEQVVVARLVAQAVPS